MDEYSIESKHEKIYNKKTKEYFTEVVSSYKDGSYRSSVVMLWSVAVCDLLFKIKFMLDMYSDPIAKSILEEVEKIQKNNPRSPDWETKLVDLVKEKTSILNISDYENLMILQRQRHLSAHPVLTEGYELHRPNRETVRALIRNTLDGVLIKPPIYTKNVFHEFINDIASASDILISKDKLKTYLESKYLSRIDVNVEVSFFRSLWKMVFLLEDDLCKENRNINFWTLEVIFDHSKDAIIHDIKEDKDYYSNIAKSGEPIVFLVYFLSLKSFVYELLDGGAKLLIKHVCENDNVARCVCHFLKDSIKQHHIDLIKWIESDSSLVLSDDDILAIKEISDSLEWDKLSKFVFNSYYSASIDYDTADTRFVDAIKSFINEYDDESLIDFMMKVENNSQTYDRRIAKRDHLLIKNRCLKVFGEDFDFTKYIKFNKSIG
jgi:hypothetical protein